MRPYSFNVLVFEMSFLIRIINKYYPKDKFIEIYATTEWW